MTSPTPGAQSAAPPSPPPVVDGSYIVVAFYPSLENPTLGSVRVQWPEDLPVRNVMAVLSAALSQVRAAERLKTSGILTPEEAGFPIPTEGLRV